MLEEIGAIRLVFGIPEEVIRRLPRHMYEARLKAATNLLSAMRGL